MAAFFGVRAMIRGYEWVWSIIDSWLKYSLSSVQPRKPQIVCPRKLPAIRYTVASYRLDQLLLAEHTHALSRA